MYHANSNHKKARVTTIVKIKYFQNNVTRENKGHLIMVKGSVLWENVTIINIHALKIEPHKS